MNQDTTRQNTPKHDAAKHDAAKLYTVLYVEDDEILREEVTTFLKRRFKHVITAMDGKDGIEKFTTYPVDFIITDLKMPVMDGLEMAGAIRKLNASIPIVITTAMSDIELMQASIETGVDRYLIKPVDFDELTKALEKIKEKLRGAHTPPLEISKSKDLEMRIESEIAKLIKSTSGKGPEKVKAFIHANLAEIVISGSRTQFEHTLLSSESNYRIGDYIRDIYYQQIRSDIEKVFRSVCGYRAVMQATKCSSQKDVDIIKLIIEL